MKEEKGLGWVGVGPLSKDAGSSTDSIKHEFDDVKKQPQPIRPKWGNDIILYANQWVLNLIVNSGQIISRIKDY